MNYAYVDTGVKEFYPAPNPLPIEGYAQNTATADLWFNRGRFEARLGYKYHSPFSIIAGWTGSDVRTLGEETILDFSTSYQVNDSFGVRLQVNNLTNEPLRITRDNSLDRSVRMTSTGVVRCWISRSSTETSGRCETTGAESYCSPRLFSGAPMNSSTLHRFAL